MCSIFPASISTPAGIGIATPAVLTGGWIKPETHFPSSLYRFIPHTPFDTIEKNLLWVAQTGFGAILLPALHAPSTVSIDGRRGSAYAPRDIMGISPVMSGLATPREYLAGGKTGKPRNSFVVADNNSGWTRLEKLVVAANELGLAVGAELILTQTAHDPDVVKVHTDRFGENFYKSADDRAFLEGDNDVREIDLEGPARREILDDYCMPLIRRMIDSGIQIFQINGVQHAGAEFWTRLIEGAKTYAKWHGKRMPVFFAGDISDPVQIETFKPSCIQQYGFDGATHFFPADTLLTDRKITSAYFSDIAELAVAGGVSVAFLDNPQRERLARVLRTVPNVVRGLALSALASPSMVVMAGTIGLERERPSVFLDKYQPPNPDFGDDGDNGVVAVRSALKRLLFLRGPYRILRSSAPTEFRFEGPLAMFHRGTSDAQALIVVNNSWEKANYRVPSQFRRENIFSTNTWRRGDTWVGASLGEDVGVYHLAPMGVAAFLAKGW